MTDVDDAPGSDSTLVDAPEVVQSREAKTILATFVAGGVAGACSRTATAPLDRVKVIVQEGHLVEFHNQHKKLSPSSSRLVEVGRIIMSDGGVRAFWRGNGVNCLKAGPEFAMVFTLRSILLDYLAQVAEREQHEEQCAATRCGPSSVSGDGGRRDSAKWLRLSSIPLMIQHFFVGAFAGAGAQAILYPLEVVKTRIAVSTSTEFSGGMLEVAREAYRRGGLREFYKGLVPNIVGIFLYRGLEVGIYTYVQAVVVSQRRRSENGVENSRRNDDALGYLSVSETATLGTVASVLAQTVTYPLNVVRTKMQTQGLQGRVLEHCGMCDCMYQVYRAGGVRGLFRGLTANYLKAAPASAIAFVVFEQTQRLLRPADVVAQV